MKKGHILLFIIVLLGFMLFFLFFNKLTGMSILDTIFKPFLEGTMLGRIFINILFLVNIDSPQNTTYNFSVGSSYPISLNVSSNRNVSSWWYNLEDLKHGTTVNSSVFFTPNTTISAVRWSNRITVYLNDTGGNTINKSIVFYINVPNNAPVMQPIPDNLYACEGSYLSYFFNVTDIDEDVLTPGLNPQYPNNPFYISSGTAINLTFFKYEIFSGTLSKSDAGGVNQRAKNYSENISVNDGQSQDSKNINITVIEINNAPVIENIGVKTVWLRGENTSFYHEVLVTDTENSNQDSGNLTINISFSGVQLFNISSNGVMNFTPNSSQIGVYNITVCAVDKGLTNPHENISLCLQTGGNRSSCNLFSLTVTNNNRPPRIVSYNPTNLTLNVSEGTTVYFNTTNYDSDGTIPDSYWYVNNIFNYYHFGDSLILSFNYTFNCTSTGNHSVIGKITDGILNSSYDSVTWNITVSESAVCCGDGVCSSGEFCSSCSVDCGACAAPAASGGGGGGGGGAAACVQKWGCTEWSQCKNLQKSLESSIINYSLMSLLKKECLIFNWNDSLCGFQVRNCIDVNKCRTNLTRPSILKGCYYTEHPDCNDSIKNCHDGSCETLVDCGGPCSSCPTCSDKIQNQGEKGIDCGGSCKSCPIEIPYKTQKILVYALLFLSILIIIIIAILMTLYRMKKKEFQKIRKDYSDI